MSGADPLEEFGSGLPMGWLTFLFTDIEGSTRLIQEIGTDRYGDLLAQHSRLLRDCLLYTSPSPRDRQKSRMPSSA